MANQDQANQRRDMTDEEIMTVFETLNLPTAPKPVPLAAKLPAGPVVFFPVSGHSPPLNAR